ncbi:MAG: hypothetical protein JO179_00210 [Solirubrobacterales bacterium]|nr:hypothetical protein [Solirubrobacterales bacterium]
MGVVAALGALAMPAGGLTGSALGAGGSPVDPTLGLARLQGQFLLSGRVTAVRVRGERTGQRVTRSWGFASPCPVGPCPTLLLVRQRVIGGDSLALQQRGPGYYTGSGSFYVPLRCGGRTYPAGELVPFSIAVRVTKATRDASGVLVASAISARYTNRYRRNLTPCVAVTGHDAALYQGQLVTGG